MPSTPARADYRYCLIYGFLAKTLLIMAPLYYGHNPLAADRRYPVCKRKLYA